jgi:hypothetical protein
MLSSSGLPEISPDVTFHRFTLNLYTDVHNRRKSPAGQRQGSRDKGERSESGSRLRHEGP